MKDLSVSYLADIYGQLLPKRSLEVLRAYVDSDLSLTEIAERLSVSKQAIGETVTKAANQLKVYDQKLGLVQRLRNCKNLVEDCRTAIEREDTQKAIMCLCDIEQQL